MKNEKLAYYIVDYIDYDNNSSSPIDTIVAPIGYTSEDYIRDCVENADEDWCEMLINGDVELRMVK